MEKYLVIDSRMRKCEKDFLEKLRYTLICVPKSDNVYEEISSHVDIFMVKVLDDFILEKSFYSYFSKYHNSVSNKFNIVCGDECVLSKYPLDILYNVCIIGKYAIHNFKYTDKTVVDSIEKHGLSKIDISQGYSKCSIALIDDKSCIVTDKKIALILKKIGIDVIYIPVEDVNISLKNGGKPSNMSGFIGGAMSRIEDCFVIFGDKKNIQGFSKIEKYILSKGIKIIDFPGLGLVDYGGIVQIGGE
ncbi:MAG: hypothetical protein RSD14_00570 [Clostridia bacterium]